MLRKIIGIDEAGRGALAGPIVAAALFIIDQQRFPFGLVKDSKQLSDQQRRRIYALLIDSCAIHFGVVSNRLIDRIGIQQANVLAIELAQRQLNEDTSEIHSDHVGAFNHYACFTQNITFHIHGESAVPEIAAASIAAKVFRDDLMLQIHERYPRYNFARHKGYGTQDHRTRIGRYGLSDMHRRSFCCR